ncbi:hypothetical protein Emed_006349 [Eimeria media]
MRFAQTALSLSSWLVAATASSSARQPSSFVLAAAAAAGAGAEGGGGYPPLLADDGRALGLEAGAEGAPAESLLHAAPTSFMDENGKNASGASHSVSESSPNAATEVGREGAPPPQPPASTTPLGGPPKKPAGGPMRLSELEELAGVVKIFVDSVKADFVSPWQVMAQTEHTGSGFAIEGQMIMTNAHLVADQTRVLVRKHGNPKRYLARVLAVCHECDLALVTVDEDSFWTGVKPLIFGEIPQLRETVAVLGYPTGGDQLSITEGVVSRVGVSPYAHSSLGLLTVQIDAAINPGNSGGPAVSKGKVVGVAFQGFSQMQNLGFIVPYPVIRHFLNDVATHRRHTGFVSIGIKAQTMENEAEGVMVTAVDQLRLRLYKEGQIVLPISRYGPLERKKDKHGRCAVKEGEQQQQQAAAPCVSADYVHTTQLLVDLPAGASGDALASQRNVKEAEARVVWEPEGWKGEGAPSGGPPQPFESSIKPHGQGLAPAPAVPLSHLQKQPATEEPLPDAEENPQATDEAAATDSTGGPSDEQQTAAAGGAQTPEKSFPEQQEKEGGEERKEEEGDSRQAEGEQEQRSAEHMQRKPRGESGKNPEEGETSDAKQREGSNKADNKHAYLGSLLRMLLKKPAAKTANLEEKENADAEVPRDEEEESEKADEQTAATTTSAQIVPSEEERGEGADGEREKEGEGRPALQHSPKERMHAAPPSTEEARIRLEVEVIKVEAASRRTEDSAEGEKQQLERKGQAEQEEESREPAAAADAVSADAQTDHAALAPAALTLAPNPYFDPEVVKDEEFFGLREGDVLLSIGNYNDGTVSFRDLERVAFTYVVTHFFNGQTTFAYVLREGRILKVTIPLMAPNLKVPPFSWDTKPSYFVFGGFVFTPLTKVLLQAKLHKEAPFVFEHLVTRLDFQEKEGDQFVVLSLILASDVSVGYEQPPSIVESVNGEEVRNMRDLVRLIESTSGEFVKLRLALGGSNHLLVVIDKQKAQAIQQKVLREHNIVRDRSPDLL